MFQDYFISFVANFAYKKVSFACKISFEKKNPSASSNVVLREGSRARLRIYRIKFTRRDNDDEEKFKFSLQPKIKLKFHSKTPLN